MSFWVGGFHLGLLSLFFVLFFEPVDLTGDEATETFLVDEALKSWLEVHDWIRAMTFPTDFKEYRNLGLLSKTAGIRQATGLPPQYSDATLTILSSANNPSYTFKFYDVFPTSLSTFVMSTTDSPDTAITADATFRYSYFDVAKVN
jgi:hypothetical protein